MIGATIWCIHMYGTSLKLICVYRSWTTRSSRCLPWHVLTGRMRLSRRKGSKGLLEVKEDFAAGVPNSNTSLLGPVPPPSLLFPGHPLAVSSLIYPMHNTGLFLQHCHLVKWMHELSKQQKKQMWGCHNSKLHCLIAAILWGISSTISLHIGSSLANTCSTISLWFSWYSTTQR